MFERNLIWPNVDLFKQSRNRIGAEVDEHEEPAWKKPARRPRLEPGRQVGDESVGGEQARKSQPTDNCQTIGGYPEMDVAIRRSGQDLRVSIDDQMIPLKQAARSQGNTKQCRKQHSSSSGIGGGRIRLVRYPLGAFKKICQPRSGALMHGHS